MCFCNSAGVISSGLGLRYAREILCQKNGECVLNHRSGDKVLDGDSRILLAQNEPRVRFLTADSASDVEKSDQAKSIHLKHQMVLRWIADRERNVWTK